MALSTHKMVIIFMGIMRGIEDGRIKFYAWVQVNNPWQTQPMLTTG